MSKDEKIETNCIKCKKVRNCTIYEGVGFLCDKHLEKEKDKIVRNIKMANWMKSSGGIWLLVIAVASLIITSVFQVLQYFKT